MNSSTDITRMSETILESISNQPLITTNDIDRNHEEKHLPSDSTDNIPFESSPAKVSKKQKSLVSVYDNSNDGEQQQQQQQQQPNQNSFPLVGILGRNPRSQAFTKRLLLSGFPSPILCDIDSTENSNYVSYETFYQQSPSIVLITDNFTNHFEYLFNPTKQQLIIDARELVYRYFSKDSPHLLVPIADSYRAFGNISNWEIENGTQRVAVAIEQSSPLHLIKFIHQLNCFSRGIHLIDQYSYNTEQIKSFRNCLFPLVSTIIIFTFCFVLSMIEYNYQENYYHEHYIYRQASSITASTSLTLLSVLFFIRPVLELIELIYSCLWKKQTQQQYVLSRFIFIQRWLQSRRYLAWYSLSFALLHLIFLLFSKNDFSQNIFFYPVFFGLVALVLLCILSFVYFPWISERLLWHEYRLLTSYLGPLCLLITFIHVFIHWKYDYYYLHRRNLFQLKFLVMILPFLVLFMRLMIYGIIHPVMKWIANRQRKNKTTTIKDTSRLP